ncbi:rhodanese-like domain-containing protein [Psychroflexus sediminis]|uniref:Rhodanese-related sulfurtransferase n=1 Tax=Psychroflexus sediminis TaxID=470826 RepID=A0A1G7ULR2_9FLAO|nr:rhodanese-like domain-containing protein [Psychroflexus sediminis]SDG48446.1 Rhodanese-related sulfurtransferase [Psychroflexus sediminis]
MKPRLILLILIFPLLAYSQSIDEAIQKYNEHKVEYISVQELAELKDSDRNIKLLDTRQASEYSISHIQNAIYAGYENFKLTAIQDKINKQDTIVVYCSIGVRSEDIGERLQKADYKHVFNLYGGIFDWVNQGRKVYDQKGEPTEKIHAYDIFWSRYLKKGQKVY